MTAPKPNTRKGLARRASIHELVVLNEAEAKNRCWRTDVSDEEWEAGTEERFGRVLMKIVGRPTDDWRDAFPPQS